MKFKIYRERLLKPFSRLFLNAAGSSAVGQLFIVFLAALFLTACTPRVEIAPSDKPITINMNIKIDHEVRIKVEKDLEEEIFSEDSDLF